MYLREIAIHADHAIVERYKGGFVQRFGEETTCVTELYAHLIHRKVSVEDTSKVCFEFTDEADGPPESWGVCRCPWPFDFARYVESDAPAKKRMILDAMQEALLWLASQEGWVTEPFVEAYEEMIRRDLMLETFAKKSWVSPNGKYRVRIWFNYDLEGIELTAVLFRNRSRREIARKPLGSARPFYGCLHYYLEVGEWTSDTTFVLRSPSTFTRETWTADFSEEIEAE